MPRRGTTLAQTERMLILAKTYPTPSKGYVETTCVAAVNESGELRRVFPVPFRLLPEEKHFTKWQWITARFHHPNDDRRPESRRIDVDTLVLGDRVGTGSHRDWGERMRWVEPHVVSSYSALEERRKATGETLGFLRPSRLIGLDITPLPASDRHWSDEEIAKLTQDMNQGDLFAEESSLPRQRRILEKLPFQAHYRYEIDTPEGTEYRRHLLTDWEVGVLYRNCRKSHGENWQEPFRAKLEKDFSTKDLVLMMGTQHRFPDQWLIISLIYPPRSQGSVAPGAVAQQTLDL